ncbi:MAG: dihydropteroate synthase [Alphaproteobacteria bacterium]|nr:dihydropteroate synthase [Alphaproteobacteria bacterium]MBM3952779.1 dihydropteroate synthase [Rhodospirillales bacterium]
MGVVNVTPDSFSDGGETADTDLAIARGRELIAAGADMIDVGGESTRPGARPVEPREEAARIVPVIRALAAEGALVSADTRHAAVMTEAAEAGARIINDVAALSEPGALEAAARSGAHVILMHMKGDPRTMQDDPRYDDVVGEVADYLRARIEACVRAGIARARIAVDPGIGFGKTVAHNARLIANLDRVKALGHPVVLGVSRKSFIAKLSRNEPPKGRLAGSLAAALAGVARGADILRVHDVAETRQALAVWGAVFQG